jgi:hypothetical protein
MAKVAYNSCYGGFSLSRAAILRAREISGDPKWGGPAIKGDLWDDGSKGTVPHDYGSVSDIPRHDPVLIQVIEELGDKANGSCAKLAIEELPPMTPYRIDEYDGNERVMTADAYEWTVAP